MVEWDKREQREREQRDKRVHNLKRRIRNIDTFLCLLFSFVKALRFLSSQLDSAVKRCSSDNLPAAERLGKGSGQKKVVGVANVANN